MTPSELLAIDKILWAFQKKSKDFKSFAAARKTIADRFKKDTSK